MARFTEKDRIRIRAALIENAKKIFTQYGLRKARIEDIARGAGISKGSFYSFFSSKEELFMIILEEIEASYRPAQLEKIQNLPLEERIRFFIEDSFMQIEKHPILETAMKAEEILHLSIHLDANLIQEHFAEDQEYMRKTIGLCLPRDARDVEPWIDLMNTIFLAYLSRERIDRDFMKTVKNLAALAEVAWRQKYEKE